MKIKEFTEKGNDCTLFFGDVTDYIKQIIGNNVEKAYISLGTSYSISDYKEVRDASKEYARRFEIRLNKNKITSMNFSDFLIFFKNGNSIYLTGPEGCNLYRAKDILEGIED